MCQKCDTGMFSGIFAKMNPKCDCKCNSQDMPVIQASRGDGAGGTRLGAAMVCKDCKHQIWLG